MRSMRCLEINMGVDFAFIDSGTGGFPYMKYLLKKAPGAECVYVGDIKNFPYGNRTPQNILECLTPLFTELISRFNPKTIVIACNTISVSALDCLRQKFPDIPIVGTVPAIKLAAGCSKNKKIGLLATNVSVNHPYTQKLISDFARDCQVFKRGDPDLISFIEHNLFTATKEERLNAIKPAVEYFKNCGCDTIILACTHFVNFVDDFNELCSPQIKVLDSREGVVKQALKVEGFDFNKLKVSGEIPKSRLFVRGLKNKSQDVEYRTLCENNGVQWCGEFDNSAE